VAGDADVTPTAGARQSNGPTLGYLGCLRNLGPNSGGASNQSVLLCVDGVVDDRESFTRWAGQRQLSLLKMAVLLTGDHQRAEDLVQEALTKVALRWGRLRDGNADAYARRIIVHDNISWWRRRRRESFFAEVDHEVTGPDVERRLMLIDALARLTPRQRAAIVLRYYVDLSERQTADLLQVSVGTVKSTTNLALRRLREAEPTLAGLLIEDPS